MWKEKEGGIKDVSEAIKKKQNSFCFAAFGDIS